MTRYDAPDATAEQAVGLAVFQAFVARRSSALLRSAWVLTGDWQEAEDLVQTALQATWTRRGRLGDPAVVEQYVRRVMLTTFLSWRRRLSSRELPMDSVSVEAADVVWADDPDLRLQLLAAVRALPRRQRAVVTLRYFDDLTETATAAVLNCSVGTVKSHTARALRSLRAHPQLAGLFEPGRIVNDVAP